MIRRSVLGLLAAPLLMPAALRAQTTDAGETDAGAGIAAAAEAQEGVVRIYDPAYVQLDFPAGDVAPDRGVCTDVLVRALRVAEGIDLQAAVNRDMKADFAAYPKNWGLTRPDRNIDHRRVPNLRRLLERQGAGLALSDDPADFRPGDVITCLIPGDLAHLMVVGTGQTGGRPLIVHNIGAGTRIEDRLFEFRMTGIYRLGPDVLEKLRRLSV